MADASAAPSSSSGAPRVRGVPQARRVPSTFDRLTREDVDQTSSLSVGDELTSFVRVYFGDGLDGGVASSGPLAVAVASGGGEGSMAVAGTDPEMRRDGSRVVWVENARTGELVPVYLRSGAADDRSSRAANAEVDETAGGEEGNAADAEEAALLAFPPPLQDTPAQIFGLDKPAGADCEEDNASHSSAAMFLRASFLLFQGLFAGFAFATVALDNTAPNDATFLTQYQPDAQEYRRLFYLLASLSAVGSLDALMTLISKTNRPSLAGPGSGSFGAALVLRETQGSLIIAVAAALLHVVGLVVSVLAGGADVLIFVKNGAYISIGSTSSNVPWTTSALADSIFSTNLKNWKGLDRARLVSAVVAWFCCCLLVWRELLAREGRGREMIRLRDVLEAWRLRTCELEGESLEELSTQELRRLCALQTLGLDRTSSALRVAQELEDGLL